MEQKETQITENHKDDTARGSKGWEVTDNEKKMLISFAILFIFMFAMSIVSFFLPIKLWMKIMSFVGAILLGVLGMGGCVLIISLNHTDKAPVVNGAQSMNAQEMTRTDLSGNDEGGTSE